MDLNGIEIKQKKNLHIRKKQQKIAAYIETNVLSTFWYDFVYVSAIERLKNNNKNLKRRLQFKNEQVKICSKDRSYIYLQAQSQSQSHIYT